MTRSGSPEIVRLVLGELETNCFVAWTGRGPCVVVDPAARPDLVLAAAGERPVAAIVLTHCHFDHLGAAGDLVRETGAPLLVHELDAPFITDSQGTGGRLFGFERSAPPADRTLRSGDTVEAGDLILEVVHTPGHTPGSICLATMGPEPCHLFAGDTLFAGSVGRTDFPRGDGRALQASIHGLASLPDSAVVHPGHGPDTTIARERRVNPFFPRA